MANMTLCSEEKIDLSNPVMRVQPDITETHHPIPHLTVVEQIKKNLSLLGNFEVANEEYGISHEGQRMFGVMGLYDLDKGPNSDYELVIGCRNSHDKAFAAAASFGTSTFVCSNFIFTGDVVISRKHTRISCSTSRTWSGMPWWSLPTTARSWKQGLTITPTVGSAMSRSTMSCLRPMTPTPSKDRRFIRSGKNG